MLYLANPCSPAVVAAMTAGKLGMISTASQGNPVPPNVAWCADNECFNDQKFTPDRYTKFLTKHTAAQRHACLFAVAPDVVGDATATLARSQPWLPQLRQLGYQAAFVAQNGAETDATLVPWSQLDCLFIGGDTAWKESQAAQHLAAEALGRGKRVHMGRVNSRRRVRLAHAFGCHTVDGTFLTFGPDVNLPRLLRWMGETETQTRLALWP